MRFPKILYLPILLVLAQFISGCENETQAHKAALGKQLFNDASLSRNGTQSCATCHDSQHAFVDARPNITKAPQSNRGAVSLGQDNTSLGDINTPTLAYKAFVPEFHFDKKEGLFIGGLFLNGRANDLNEQAEGPLLNEVEMQNTKQGVVAAVKAKYKKEMSLLYGDSIFNDVNQAFKAIADAISQFEKTEEFFSFDSKFDKVLKGEASFTAQELRGLDLFKAEDKGNCAACHPVPEKNSSQQQRLFTDFSYDNLGTPKNILVRSKNDKGLNYVDEGLFSNPKVNDPELKGAFRVSTLRNIAVTGPYMHNGVFKNLSTVVHFYNTRDVAGAKNPETGKPWRNGEIDKIKNTDELGDLKLKDNDIDDIVAFLKTLTDARYEHLIP